VLHEVKGNGGDQRSNFSQGERIVILDSYQMPKRSTAWASAIKERSFWNSEMIFGV